MSGKLIRNLKRKREEAAQADYQSNTGSASTDEQEEDEPAVSDEKRFKVCECERSDESDAATVRSSGASEDKTGFLLEALKKIVELQNELDEMDEEGSESDSYCSDDLDGMQYDPAHEAGALGFAMCARETLLFLQREGYSTDSPIYRSLRDRLVGSVNGIPI